MTVNEYFQNVAKMKYLVMKVINKSCIHEEIKRIFNWRMTDAIQF